VIQLISRRYSDAQLRTDMLEGTRASHTAGVICSNKVAGSPRTQDSWVLLHSQNFRRGGFMLRWPLIFLVVAILAAVLGFAGVVVAAAEIAKFSFNLFLVLFAIPLVVGPLPSA
jgi:uncharacterized membrane protein YtjA (UPF0391 family)